MPQQIDSASPTLLSRLTRELHGRKVRIVGWMLACELDVLLVAHAGHGVLVDISACLQAPPAGERGGVAGLTTGLGFLGERKRKVMVIGVVDVLPDGIAIPKMNDATSLREAGAVDGCVVVRAVLVREVDGMSLEEWERGIVAGLEAARREGESRAL